MPSDLDVVEAPWSDEQVANINEYQRSGAFHPFTCECPHPERNDRFVAYKDGLWCAHCGYRQTWVHYFMADGSTVADWQEMMTATWQKEKE